MKADLVFREIPVPFNNWCSSGHCAPKMFKRNGPDLPEEPTKFYIVNGGDISNLVVCEPCLIIAQHIAQEKRKGNII